MTNVEVLFFADLRESVGRERIEVRAGSAPSVSGLLRHLGDLLGAQASAALTAESVRVAVNQELISGDVVLAPGDEVAFLPPVTGG
jgi:molybdopterin converting factor subunit 1